MTAFGLAFEPVRLPIELASRPAFKPVRLAIELASAPASVPAFMPASVPA